MLYAALFILFTIASYVIPHFVVRKFVFKKPATTRDIANGIILHIKSEFAWLGLLTVGVLSMAAIELAWKYLHLEKYAPVEVGYIIAFCMVARVFYRWACKRMDQNNPENRKQFK